MVKGYGKSLKRTSSTTDQEMPLKRSKIEVEDYKKLHEFIERLC